MSVIRLATAICFVLLGFWLMRGLSTGWTTSRIIGMAVVTLGFLNGIAVLYALEKQKRRKGGD